MQQEIDREDVISYYNEHTKNKLKDYIKVSPRVASAWESIKKWAPLRPLRVLEVGCGIGSISAKMNARWPAAKITGIDISSHSIQLAQKLFANENLNYFQSILEPATFNEQFDLIVFMDVYEHISPEDRPQVHAALRKIIRNEGRIFLSVPTPQNLSWSAKHKPETMQPVDEHISFDVVGKLAMETQTDVIYYEKRNIWNVGDYTHIVLERNDDFEAAFFNPKPVTALERAKRILDKGRYKLGSFFRQMFVQRRLK